MKNISNLIYGKNVSEKQISDLLKRLGFSVAHKGFHYIKYAFLLAIKESDDYLFNLSNMLYPRISKEFNTSPVRVERDIRYSIDFAFTISMPISDISEIFDYSYSCEKGKPTNSQFFATIAEYIKYYY